MRCLLVLTLTLPSVCDAFTPHPQDELKNAAKEFVRLIESRDTAALTDQFSEQGTTFIGTAYSPAKVHLSREEIRRDLESKTGVYCLFFDSKCFQEEDVRERVRQKARSLDTPLRSIADLLTGAKEKRFVAYGNLRNPKVTVLLSGRTPDTAILGVDAVNFYFRWEQGRWRLRNVEYN